MPDDARRPENRLFIADKENMLTLKQQAKLVEVAATATDPNVKRQALRLLELAEQPLYLVAGREMFDVDTPNGTVSIALSKMKDLSCPEHMASVMLPGGGRRCTHSDCAWAMTPEDAERVIVGALNDAPSADRTRTTADETGMYRHSSRDDD